jgi:hypothetical protein
VSAFLDEEMDDLLPLFGLEVCLPILFPDKDPSFSLDASS